MNNREIKFRARIIENGNPRMFYQDTQYLISFLRRVTSHLYFQKDDKDVDEMNGGVHESKLTKPYELENCLDRYTGLKDKNGKECYEGDKIESIDPDGKPIIYTVSWNSERARFFPFEELTENGFIIIGNVFENPNLLQDNKQGE